MLFEGDCIFSFWKFYKYLLCILVEVNKTTYGNNEDVQEKRLNNESPPWAAYRALMSRRLVALDKQPGVWPVAISKIWQWCIAKGNLVGSGAEAKGTCESVQLCAGLEAGIKGALHAVRLGAETNESMQF
jgi:hypothetical protein